MNYVNFGGHLINLDQIVDIQTDVTRANWENVDKNYHPVVEPCVIFVRPVAATGDYGGGSEEIAFFSPQREVIIEWLLGHESALPKWDVPLPPARKKPPYEDHVADEIESGDMGSFLVPLNTEDLPF